MGHTAVAASRSPVLVVVGVVSVLMGSSSARAHLDVLYVWNVAREQLRGRAPRQLGELAVHVGLVVVAADGGDLTDRHVARRLEHATCPVEADHTGRQLGWQPELVREATPQVLAAPPDLRRERPDLERTVGGLEQVPRARQLGRERGAGLVPGRE